MVNKAHLYGLFLISLGLSTSTHAMRKMQKLNSTIQKMSKRGYGTFLNQHHKAVSLLLKSIPSPVIARYEKDGPSSGYPTPMVAQEFVRYAYLVKWLQRHKEDTQPLEMYSPYVDGFWHAYLLFNQSYGEFCLKLPQKRLYEKMRDFLWYGKPFSSHSHVLYHHPHTPNRGTSCAYEEGHKKGYFIRSYKQVYTISPNLNIWTGLQDSSPQPSDQSIREWLDKKEDTSTIKRYDFGHQPLKKDTSSSSSGCNNTDVLTTMVIAQSLHNNFDNSSSDSSSSSSKKSSSSCSSCSSGSSSGSSCSSSSDSGSSCSSCGGD